MDYILSIVGVTGFFLAGKKVWWAWYVNIACQALWVTYAMVTAQYGFLIGAVVYSMVFIENARKWTKEHKRETTNNLDDASSSDHDEGENYGDYRLSVLDPGEEIAQESEVLGDYSGDGEASRQ